VTEPPWLDWEADIELTPVMTLAGLKNSGSDMERIVSDRS